MNNLFLYTRYIYEVPFFVVVEFQWIYPEKLFVVDDACLRRFHPCVKLLFVKHVKKNRTRIFDVEFFVPVSSLCGVVGSPSYFIKCLIGKTGKV